MKRIFTKKNTLVLFAFLSFYYSYSQVGIGTTAPRGAVDIASTTQGLVFPNVALVNTITETAVNPQGGSIPTGTVVYNTATSGTSPNNVAPGLYYWNGSRWIAFAGSPGGLDWSLTGNSGTTAGTNFLGTTDAQGLIFRTNNTEAMRVGTNQTIGVNSANQPWTQFFSYSDDNSIYALTGYSDIGGGTGVYARSTGSGSTGMFANNDNQGGWGAYGYNSNTTSGVGTVGQSNGTTGTGVVGLADGSFYSTLTGHSQGIAGTGSVGVYGMSTGTVGAQRYGGYFSYDMDNDLSTNDTNSPLAILAGRSDDYLTSQVYFGGYFSGGQDTSANNPNTAPDTNGNGNTGDFAYVGARWGTTNYKILGNGVVSTIIDGVEDNKKHIMFAPEAPEILFQDYGTGKLNNGTATINIDPILSKNIVVNEDHPLKVFIQLEGDCNGVYVTNKSAESFTVKELQGGSSNVGFSYQIVATRVDRVDNEGNVLSKNANVRLPVAPKPLDRIEIKKIESKIFKEKKVKRE